MAMCFLLKFWTLISSNTLKQETTCRTTSLKRRAESLGKSLVSIRAKSVRLITAPVSSKAQLAPQIVYATVIVSIFIKGASVRISARGNAGARRTTKSVTQNFAEIAWLMGS